MAPRPILEVVPQESDNRAADTGSFPIGRLPAPEIDKVIEWLTDGAPGITSAEQLIVRLVTVLRKADIPVDRVAVFVSTLHPSVAGRGFDWSVDAGVHTREVAYEDLKSGPFARSPIMTVVRSKESVRRRIADRNGPRDYPILADLEKSGFTDYIVLPLKFMTGQCHAFSLATKAEEGFAARDIEVFRRILGPLTRVVEIIALRRVAGTLLSTYVGHDSGERILSGRIQRGHIEMIRSVIWFSDLRGFTNMSATRPASEMIGLLNDVFDCQVPAIEKRGGEVLKFIGDGMLASFPVENDADLDRIVDLAIDAAEEAQSNVAKLGAERGSPVRVGIALNFGEVAYGNIGGANRLDFTAIGAAVNLTARLEGLTGQLNQPLLVSEEIARRTQRPTRTLGSFTLKGVPQPVEAFALADDT